MCSAHGFQSKLQFFSSLIALCYLSYHLFILKCGVAVVVVEQLKDFSD